MPDPLSSHPSPAEQHDYAPALAQVDPGGGFGRIALRVIAAAILAGALVAGWFYYGQRKPIANGDVARITLYPIHNAMSGGSDQEGMAGQNQSYDQLIVFTQIHVHNLSSAPITILELQGNLTMQDATESTSLAASQNDSNRLFGAYPQLSPLRLDPLLRNTVIQPGQTAEGMLVFNYSMNKAQWEQRKKFEVNVTFDNGMIIHLDGSKV
jgi:hypothetical protein